MTDEELTAYLDSCKQPWRDAATIISEEGMRPGEVFALRWPHLFIGEDGTGLIRVMDGKSKAACRILPMTPVVYALLKDRNEAQGRPVDGWVFPRRSNEGHLIGDHVKDQHIRAVKDSRVAPFVPYVLRHTALTRLAMATNGDLFALARIAGHSTITITQRYVHTQANTIDGIFARALKLRSNREEKAEYDTQNAEVGTKLGTARESTRRLLDAEKD